MTIGAKTLSAAGQPRIPQPPATVAALRQALRQVAPAALPAFTRELDEAAGQPRPGSDLAPLRRFLAQWAVYVHIHRQPGPAAEFRRWEDGARSGDAAEVRRAASELGRILDEAHARVLGARPT